MPPSPSTLLDSLKHHPANHPHVKILTGKTPSFASTMDQRFSFSCYVPQCHSFNGPTLPLLVIIHGTRRQTGRYIDKLKDFCETHSVVLLCPLFPAGIIDYVDVHNYKNILYKDIRFDTILLSMIDQASQIWRINTDQFFLHGFSGGGQFAHRFMYLHPERIAGVSIGAPGRITPPDTSKPWPAGVGNISELFSPLENPRPDFDRMARVPVQFIVGEKDTDVSWVELVKDPNEAEIEAGKTRIERLRWLKKAWEAVGISSELTVVPKVAHEGVKCLPELEVWLKKHLKTEKAT
ncbi:alpha/beta-hydrolase [Marasmius fiardii PR-910]|nr:alpha/beta-hydrolase [Marasmius fiardii PR-910]